MFSMMIVIILTNGHLIFTIPGFSASECEAKVEQTKKEGFRSAVEYKEVQLGCVENGKPA